MSVVLVINTLDTVCSVEMHSKGWLLIAGADDSDPCSLLLLLRSQANDCVYFAVCRSWPKRR